MDRLSYYYAPRNLDRRRTIIAMDALLHYCVRILSLSLKRPAKPIASKSNFFQFITLRFAKKKRFFKWLKGKKRKIQATFFVFFFQILVRCPTRSFMQVSMMSNRYREWLTYNKTCLYQAKDYIVISCRDSLLFADTENKKHNNT